MKFQHILFPVDLSGRACSAAPHVLAWAGRFRARLTLLHVSEDLPLFTGMEAGFSIEAELEAARRHAARKLEQFEKEMFLGAKVFRVALRGNPAGVIADFARAENVDLIMMPTHGRGPFRSLLLGSVAAKVLHDSTCPVWTDAHEESPATQPRAAAGPILCAADLKPESVALIRQGASLARDFNVPLKLVHATPESGARPAKYFNGDLEAYLRDFARDEMARIQSEAGSDLDVRIAGGPVSRVVAEEAARIQAQLVLIGRGASTKLFGRLRTHAYSIIRDSPCPVLSV